MSCAAWKSVGSDFRRGEPQSEEGSKIVVAGSHGQKEKTGAAGDGPAESASRGISSSNTPTIFELTHFASRHGHKISHQPAGIVWPAELWIAATPRLIGHLQLKHALRGPLIESRRAETCLSPLFEARTVVQC